MNEDVFMESEYEISEQRFREHLLTFLERMTQSLEAIQKHLNKEKED